MENDVHISVGHGWPISGDDLLQCPDGDGQGILPVLLQQAGESIEYFVDVVLIHPHLFRILGPHIRPVIIIIDDHQVFL